MRMIITLILTHLKRTKLTHPATVDTDPPFGVGFEGVKLGWVLGLFASQ